MQRGLEESSRVNQVLIRVHSIYYGKGVNIRNSRMDSGISDVGLLGRPNAGKDTFITRVSKCQPKIAGYHFTLTSKFGLFASDSRRCL